MNKEIKKIITITVLAGFIFFWNIPGVLVLAEGENGEASGSAVIVTGDADSNLNINNEANTNTLTTTTPEPTPESTPTPTPELTPEASPEILEETSSPTPEPTPQPDNGIENLTSNNESKSEIANTGSSSAETGENEADGGGGGATIISGNANAEANVLNIANTNIIDSEGLFLLYNIFSALWGDLDLREWIQFDPSQCPSGCQLINNLNVTNNNTASISNDITVSASTGGNTANSTGDAIIATGNANAAANVVNVINTNITGSNYILLTLNNFSDWIGDLVLPSQMFLEKLIGQPIQSNSQGGAANIQNDSEAGIENQSQSSAETGGNETETESGNTLIATGDAQSSSNTLNVVNQNIIDSHSLFILIRVHGNWRGNIFNMPAGAQWQKTSDGISIYGENGTGSNNECCGPQNASVSNTNLASIKNKVNVFALTGNNKVITLKGDGAILTGNANAAANIVNIVNTNIFGRNWIFALINIFGDWQGNLSFGQPDLWIGGEADLSGAQNPLPGHLVNYKFTIINKGDAAASNIRLTNLFDPYQNLEQYSPGTKQGNNQLDWRLGTLQPGKSITVTYSANVRQDISVGYSTINTRANVSSYETDANPADNQELLSFRVYQPYDNPTNTYLSNDGQNSSGQGAPSLRITKTNDAAGLIHPKEHLKFTVKLTNEGTGSAHNVVVKDKLYDPISQIIHEEEWELGEVFANEEIILDYTIEINENGKSGKYVNTAYTDAVNSNDNLITTVYASSSFEFTNSEISTETSLNLNQTAAQILKQPLGQEARAKEETNQQNSDGVLNPRNDLFGSLLLSMFDFLNDLPPVMLTLDALLILALILLALKKRKKEEDPPDE